MSLSDRFHEAIELVSSSPDSAVDQLTALQQEAASLFSSNEGLDDISTGTLPFLGLEHHLAKALVALPVDPVKRLKNLRRATDCWQVFLERLDVLEQLSKEEEGQYQSMLELSTTSIDGVEGEEMKMLPPPISREAKISRFKVQKEASQHAAKLHAMKERRARLGFRSEDQMDGQDGESLERAIHMTNLTRIWKPEAFEEWSSVLQELPLLTRMIKMQSEQSTDDARYSRASNLKPNTRQTPPLSNKPLEVTHITKDALSGRLLMERQEIRSNVFRPGWNQPTMSLEEFAQKEVEEALAREEHQKQAEAAQKEAPRRYDQLVKDGMEDNAHLVDASAALDRKWDNFKDENPRGSGNKRADVGDRNF